MRAVEQMTAGCCFCGAGQPYRPGAARPGGRLEASGGSWLRSPAAPRARSGLAYVAGYTGLVYVFGASLSAFVFGWLGVRSLGWMLAVSAWGLFAPAALALSFAAAVHLDEHPEKAGRLPTMLAYFIGIWGTIDFLNGVADWARYFAAQ